MHNSGAVRRESAESHPRLFEIPIARQGWLGNLDSNQDKQSQSLLCYRYTIPHRSL
jgi:hypothetical protein